jgi:hypothetical protein
LNTDLNTPSNLCTDEKGPSPESAHISYVEANTRARRGKYTYVQSLRIYSGTLTKESIFKIFVRPILLLALPPVLWATLVMSVTIGFLVAISSNFASAFQTTYGFLPYQSGLCFVSGLVGSLFGILGGG